MSPFTVLRFNFANPGGDAAVQREAVATAMEMARWGETRGIGAISFDEHHQTGHGWSSNPILLAGMALAQTSHLIASIDCSRGPLWNPAAHVPNLPVTRDTGSGINANDGNGQCFADARRESSRRATEVPAKPGWLVIDVDGSSPDGVAEGCKSDKSER